MKPKLKPENLGLKWGTIKFWNDIRPANMELLKQYMEEAPASCMMDNPDKARKELLCQLIDNIDGTIWNDWNGKKMTKKAAKEYVINYGNK